MISNQPFTQQPSFNRLNTDSVLPVVRQSTCFSSNNYNNQYYNYTNTQNNNNYYLNSSEPVIREFKYEYPPPNIYRRAYNNNTQQNTPLVSKSTFNANIKCPDYYYNRGELIGPYTMNESQPNYNINKSTSATPRSIVFQPQYQPQPIQYKINYKQPQLLQPQIQYQPQIQPTQIQQTQMQIPQIEANLIQQLQSPQVSQQQIQYNHHPQIHQSQIEYQSHQSPSLEAEYQLSLLQPSQPQLSHQIKQQQQQQSQIQLQLPQLKQDYNLIIENKNDKENKKENKNDEINFTIKRIKTKSIYADDEKIKELKLKALAAIRPIKRNIQTENDKMDKKKIRLNIREEEIEEHEEEDENMNEFINNKNNLQIHLSLPKFKEICKKYNKPEYDLINNKIYDENIQNVIINESKKHSYLPNADSNTPSLRSLVYELKKKLIEKRNKVIMLKKKYNSSQKKIENYKYELNQLDNTIKEKQTKVVEFKNDIDEIEKMCKKLST